MRQTSKKKLVTELILNMGSYPGIKFDTGAKVLAGSPDEKITEGLDGLRERLKEYYKLGAKFTKWRGVYNINSIKCPCASKILCVGPRVQYGSNSRARGTNGW